MRLAEFIGYIRKNYLENRSDALEFASSVFCIPYNEIPLRMSEDVQITDEIKSKTERLTGGEPLAYVINNKSFYGLDMYVDRRVLIPRPETELIPEKVIELCRGREIRMLDICTGSGCIPAAILSELPNARADVLDISQDALDVADINLNRYASGRYNLINGDALDILSYVSGKYDIITCNPPYLDDTEWESSDISLKYEPKNALTAGSDGLLFYKKLIDMIPDLCNKNGVVLFELGIYQSSALCALHPYKKFHFLKDYQGIERVLLWINS